MADEADEADGPDGDADWVVAYMGALSKRMPCVSLALRASAGAAVEGRLLGTSRAGDAACSRIELVRPHPRAFAARGGAEARAGNAQGLRGVRPFRKNARPVDWGGERANAGGEPHGVRCEQSRGWGEGPTGSQRGLPAVHRSRKVSRIAASTTFGAAASARNFVFQQRSRNE